MSGTKYNETYFELPKVAPPTGFIQSASVKQDKNYYKEREDLTKVFVNSQVKIVHDTL